MYWPKFKNAFLGSIAFGLKKRHKALKHSVRKFQCERIIEAVEGQRSEKLELEHSTLSARRVCVRVFAWDDRWLWIDARAATKKGWAWEWTGEGRVLGEREGGEIVGAVEATLQSIHGIESKGTSELSGAWAKLLAQGPKRGPAPLRGGLWGAKRGLWRSGN